VIQAEASARSEEGGLHMKKISLTILMGATLLLSSALPGLAMGGARGPVGLQGNAPVGFQGRAPVGFQGRSAFQGRAEFHGQFHGRPGFRGHPGFHGHPVFRSRIIIAPGFGWYPGYPYYWDPPTVVQEAPPVYVQPGTDTQQPAYWYYCQNSQSYYPYVKECPGGWLTVVPQATPPAPPVP